MGLFQTRILLWNATRLCFSRHSLGFWARAGTRNTTASVTVGERLANDTSTMSSTLPRDFKLERYFAKFEFTTKHLICCSDAEALSMRELLDMADEESRALWDNLKLSYTESSGHPLLRREAAQVHGIADDDDVLIITPQEGIYIAMHCLVDYLKTKHGVDKLHVVATNPAYQSLHENLLTTHCELSPWTARYSHEDGWTFSLPELQALLRPDTKLLVVNFPHNPTGYLPTEGEWNELVQLCKSRGIFLFSDEMYRFTNNDGSLVTQSACAMYDNAVTLSGMSKTLALPGLRIGWLCTKNKALMAKMASFKDYITICSASPSEILAIMGLRNKQKLIDRTMDIVRTNLAHLDDFLPEFKDVLEWKRPRASTTGFLRLKGWALEIGTGGGASGFCQVLVEEVGVLLLPAAMYDFPDEFVRVGFGRSDFASGLKVFGDFLRKHRPQK